MAINSEMPSLRANRLVWTVLAPGLAFLGVMVGVALLMRSPFDWEPWRPATCMPGACFCEAIRSGSVRQVANTWSSFAFVWVAFWVVGVVRFDRLGGFPQSHRDATRGLDAQRVNSIGAKALSTDVRGANVVSARPNAMSQRVVYPLLFALALFVVGVGSALYHASLTFVGQFVDVFGMYLLGTFVLVYNVARLQPMSDGAAVTLYAALNVGLAVALYSMPELRRYAFAIVIIAALAAEYRIRSCRLVRARTRYLVGAVGVLAIAFVVWALDLRRVFCNPESLWQGHALWHVLGAVACAGVYLFYRSEHTGRGPVSV